MTYNEATFSDFLKNRLQSSNTREEDEKNVQKN